MRDMRHPNAACILFVFYRDQLTVAVVKETIKCIWSRRGADSPFAATRQVVGNFPE
jgi:hypothetical protein